MEENCLGCGKPIREGDYCVECIMERIKLEGKTPTGVY